MITGKKGQAKIRSEKAGGRAGHELFSVAQCNELAGFVVCDLNVDGVGVLTKINAGPKVEVVG